MKILLAILLLVQVCAASEIRSAFDIGTGKIKMQVASVDEDHIVPLYCRAEKISQCNAQIVNKEGEITREGQAGIVEILRSLKAAGERYGSTKCDAVATELFRTAVNGREIVENISALLNMEIRIITPEEEGILSFLTIVQEENLNPEEIVVLDIGSGSFQITCIPGVIQESTPKVLMSPGIEIGGGGDCIEFNTIPSPANSIAGAFTRPGSQFLNHSGYKQGDRFLVHSAPFGRIPTYELVKNNRLSSLQIALSNINPEILGKIRDCKNRVIGIGAHPKHILKAQTIYDPNDLEKALLTNAEVDQDHADLLLVKTIMESLSITQINYKTSFAGNTSGMLVLSRSL